MASAYLRLAAVQAGGPAQAIERGQVRRIEFGGARERLVGRSCRLSAKLHLGERPPVDGRRAGARPGHHSGRSHVGRQLPQRAHVLLGRPPPDRSGRGVLELEAVVRLHGRAVPVRPEEHIVTQAEREEIERGGSRDLGQARGD